MMAATNDGAAGSSGTPRGPVARNDAEVEMPSMWLLVGAAVLVLLYVWYAVIVARHNKVKEALSSVDVHLKQRHDLIPNIIKLAQRFMDHERGLIEEVTRLRSRADAAIERGPAAAKELFQLENQLGRGVSQILATLESYPTLKSDTNVLEAQRTWTETEAQITAARRFYNAAVNRLRNAVQIFPGPVLATLAGVETVAYYEAEPEARVAPDVDAIMGPRTTGR